MTARELSRRNSGESGRTHRPRHKTARSVNETETGTNRTVGAHSVGEGCQRKDGFHGSIQERAEEEVRGHPRQQSGGRRFQRSHASEQRRASAKGCSRGGDPSCTRCEVREHWSEWAGRVRVSVASKREHRVSQSHHEGARAELGVLHVHHLVARREVRVGRRELDGWLPIGIGMDRCSCGSHSHPCGTHDRSCGARARSCGVHLYSCGPRER